jgi:2-(1,2-epoxy-1,2-dihydrophenyl)acetyl-CoA isomerase
MKANFENGVAELWLDRGDRRNALDFEFANEFRGEVGKLREREDLRVVLLAAEGPAFCVGGDIGVFERASDPEAAVRASAEEMHAGLLALADLEVPVVARIQGPAAGAGLGLVFAADIAIAARSAHFSLGYTAIGLTPDAGVTWWLPRLVGPRRATELALTNRRLPAAEAAEIGLITESVPDEHLDERVRSLVTALAAGPTSAYAAALRQIREGESTGLDLHLQVEALSIGASAASPNGREGVAAFLAKRPPRFGR